MKRAASVGLICAAAAGIALSQNPNPYIQITTGSPLPSAYINIAYSNFFQAITFQSGLAVTWSVVAGTGTVPPGLFLNATTGELAGTATTPGTYSFRVQAQLTNGGTAPPDTKTFTITVANPQLTITSNPLLPNGFANQPYLIQLTAAASPPTVTWSSSGPLPPGLSLNALGQISGAPTTPGSYSFRVFAQLGTSNISTYQDFTLSVYSGQATILTTSLPTAYSGQPYSATLTANVVGPVWAISPLSILPPGITFNTATGTLSGTTVATGTYKIQVQATATNYAPASQTLTLYVASAPLSIVETSIPIAIQGTLYRVTLTPSGGVGPYFWSFASTNNQNLTIDPNTGVISGVPSALGPFTLVVSLSDVTNALPFTRAYTSFVAAPLTVTTTSLAPGAPLQPYSQTLSAGGGQAPFVWTMGANSGPLPPGLSISTSGVISGTIAFNAAGVYTFIVQVTDLGNRVAVKTLSIAIGTGLTLGPPSLPDAVIGKAYAQTLSVAGGTSPYTFSIAAGQLPGGLTLNTSTGAITGTASVGGASTFTAQVTDSTPGGALTTQKAFTINVETALTVTTTTLPGATVGAAYSTTLQASGGIPPYAWVIASGSLPAGLSLNSSTGVISGTTASPGSSTIIVTASDSGTQSAQTQFVLTVAAAGTPPSITTGNLTATLGVAFSQTLAASGGTPPYTFALTSGTLPAGLSFSSGTITGTPTAAGTSNVTFTVTDASQQSSTKAITIVVNLPATPTLTITVGSGTTGPAQQPTVNLTLGSTYPADITVALALSFQSAVGGDDQTVQFITSNGATRNLSVTIPANSKSPLFPPALATGTLAGTITITAEMSANGTVLTPSPTPTTLTIAKLAPVIQSVTFSNTGGGLTVTVIGYSTSRDMVSGDFVFAPATGTTLAQSDVVVQLGSAFSAWYQNSASNAFGSQFKLTMPFTVSANPATIVSVSVKLTNSVGTSGAVSPQ